MISFIQLTQNLFFHNASLLAQVEYSYSSQGKAPSPVSTIVGLLIALLLVAVLVGGPVVAIIAFSIFATVMIAPVVGGASQSVCGGPSSSLSLAVNIAIRRSASARVRLGLNASNS